MKRFALGAFVALAAAAAAHSRRRQLTESRANVGRDDHEPDPAGLAAALATALRRPFGAGRPLERR